MEREAEIFELLRDIKGQLATMDVRLSSLERDMATVKNDVAAIKGVTQLIPSLVNTVNDLHDKEIVRSGLFPARA